MARDLLREAGILTNNLPGSASRIPQTTTKTSYALTLHATVGDRRGQIGAVHEIGLGQSRVVDEEYEVNSKAKGLPRALVPQILSARRITLKRYDLYTSTMEHVFGLDKELLTLLDQIGPVSLRMTWRRPVTSNVGALLNPLAGVTAYEFCDAYITDLNRTVSADNVIVGADAVLTWRTVRKLN